jgi:Cu(I)/Ag(I) efflux system membrane protein CusA/SilA
VIGRLVEWCTCHAGWVLGVAVFLALAGEVSRRSLSRDAVPDLSDPQIGIVADWNGHPSREVASRVTRVLADALSSLPGSTAIRSSSMSGTAYVDVIFGSSSGLEQHRREIEERVAGVRARLPANVRTQIGPAASSTGWIYQYALVNPAVRGASPALRQIQDNLFRPALEAIPGVAEVAAIGEPVDELLVVAPPEELRARGVAFSDLASALAPAARGNGEDIHLEQVPLAGASSRTVVGDVAHVSIDADMPLGIADFGGAPATVGGIVVARRGADPRAIIETVERKLEELRPRLPRNVQLVTVYNRLDLAGRVEHTLVRALCEEVVFVALVILVFLLHKESALVPLLTLPLVVLATFIGMRVLRVSSTIMSLGGIGIALGMAIDADVVALEACHRRLEALPKGASAVERRRALVTGASTLVPAILTSLVITALGFLPVFAFSGETGRLLRPLALTKTLVIAMAALVTLTVAPALRSCLLRGGVRPEFENPITRRLVRVYRPFVTFALSRPLFTLTTAALAVASCLPLVSRLGGEFLPRVDEGDLLFMPTTLPGVREGEAAVDLRKQDQILSQFPEVASVFGKVGRADTATDPAPYSMVETTVRLKPRSKWPLVLRSRWYTSWAPPWLGSVLGLAWPERTPETTAELVAKLDDACRLPGWTSAWTAPARARMDMMSTNGVRTPVAIRIVAATPERLDALGRALHGWAEKLPGTRNAAFESLGGEPWLTFDADPEALARFGADPDLVKSTADLMTTGGQAGEIEMSNRGFATRRSAEHAAHSHGTGSAYAHEHAHLDPDALAEMSPQRKPYRVRVAAGMTMQREDADDLREVTVRGASGAPVPLGLLGKAAYIAEPGALRTEGNDLVGYVYVDLKNGVDVESYARNAQDALHRAEDSGAVRLAGGERVEWTGQAQLLEAGKRRLQWIAPMTILVMFGLLFWQFRSFTEAIIVLLSVPFALVGSIWTLYLLHYPLSAPVWVGLLSTVGLAMQTGVVMVVYIDEAFHRRVREGRLRTRKDIIAAHAEGTVQRLRPKIMTITTMAAGLLPLLWADGAGAEIMKRVAAPMLGGLLTSAFLTLEVLPVIYTVWRHYQLRRAQASGRPIEAVVGGLPAWARDEASNRDPAPMGCDEEPPNRDSERIRGAPWLANRGPSRTEHVP